MLPSGAKSLSIKSLAGEVIDVINIIPEGSEYKKEPVSEKEANGNLIFNGFNCALEIVSADVSKFPLLETWMKAKTKIQVTVYGFNESLNWKEYSTFLVERSYKIKFGQRNTFTLRLQFKGDTSNIYTDPYYIIVPPLQ